VLLAATLTDACGEDPGGVCEWVFNRTDSETLAKLASWFVDRPMRITLIILVAFVVNFLVRRALSRFVDRMTRERQQATDDTVPAGRMIDVQLLERLRERDERSQQRALTLAAVLRNIASVVIYGIAALLCLGELEVNLGPLIAGAGIAGIAIGFGAQSLVRDFLAGMFIVLEDQYGVGDDVNLGDASGTVEKVTLRTTWLRDMRGTLWVVPNGEIKRVANRSQRWARALLDLRVSADADLDLALDVARRGSQDFFEHGPDKSLLLEKPKVLGVESFLDGAAVLRITVKTKPGDQYKVARSLRVALRRAFDAEGIPMTDDVGPVAPPPPPKP
jgi:small conductance mechanosensitive channel